MSQATEQTKSALALIQDFDIDSLAREEELGIRFSFSEVLPHVSKIKGFYGKFSGEFVDSLPDSQAKQITDRALTSYENLNNIMKFDPVHDGIEGRDNLIKAVKGDYDNVFNALYPLIAYGSNITVSTENLEREFNVIIDQARKDIKTFTSEIDNSKNEAGAMLESIRVAAAESGVSQQAIHFQKESDSHDKLSKCWRTVTLVCVIVLASYSVMTITNKPDDFFLGGDIQLAVGKVLLFAVLSYGVFLSARNFMSHTHNSIVNKHRQNALMTFRALADAALDDVTRDVILTHASACIFSPQDTGYTKSDGKSTTTDPPVIGLIPKIMARSE